MRIGYYICADAAIGDKECEARGWLKIAAHRFVTEERADIRVVRRFADMHPLAAVTPMFKGSDFEKNPEAGDFEKFVGMGRAVWVG